MPAIHIERSIEIEVGREKLYGILTDFKQWPQWSPWLIQEPECSLEYSDDGLSYAWQGKRIGSGNMRIESKSDSQIKYALQFIKPWKSSATVYFSLADIGSSSTKVTWSMDSHLPVLMFWMKKMMETFVGMDYERGLSMLKVYSEKGEVDFSKNETKVIAKNMTLLTDSDNIESDIESGLVREALYVGEKTTFVFDKSVVSGFNPAVFLNENIEINGDSENFQSHSTSLS